MKFSIYTTDISTCPTEIVCTSTNPHLQLMAGSGASIRFHGGQVIQDECNRIIAEEREKHGRAYLIPGAAVMTGAGRLPFRGAIHCVAADPFHSTTADIIRQCVRNALALTARMEPPAQSIGFPVLATGHVTFDFEESLSLMLDELFQCGDGRLQEVAFIVPDETQAQTAKALLERLLGYSISVSN